MSIVEEVRENLKSILQIGDRAKDLNSNTPLLGNIPELDSMAVAMLITSFEEYFDILIEDDDISAETFETFGSLCDFIERKAS